METLHIRREGGKIGGLVTLGVTMVAGYLGYKMGGTAGMVAGGAIGGLVGTVLGAILPGGKTSVEAYETIKYDIPKNRAFNPNESFSDDTDLSNLWDNFNKFRAKQETKYNH